MAHGTVKFFNAAKGFGFITSDDDGKDVFVPAASVSAAGISGLKTGQRLSFDSETDKKGLKAVGLKLLDEPIRAVEKKAPAPQAEKPRLTLYLDPSDEDGEDALDMLREAGHEPRVVDYIAAPPPANELKRLSLLLRDGNQSLVRKYEPMFLELRLDDRFIGDNEFWGAIHEHPSLINGPVVATATMASVCRTEKSLTAFLEALASGQTQIEKPKGLSDRLLRLMAGETLPPRPIQKPEEKPAEPPPAPVKASAPPSRKAAPKDKPAPKAKAVAKPAAKAKAAATKPAARKAAAKPAKKAKK
jgi:cold shock CspA family protein/arsenate reductase-like glutaredoxin family protein